MGYLLKEALKMLCGVNRWSYAAFWKIGCQNPKLLIWEECYYEPVLCTSQDSGMGTSEMAWREWEGCLIAPHHDVQARERIELLINQMMVKNQISIVGERIIGRAAFTGNHEWILSEGYNGDIHPPVVFNEMQNQFSAGIKTVAVIPVSPHGVVQLGSSLSIAENVGFVSDVRSLILQLGYIPGALFSDGYAEKSSLEMPYMNPSESIEAATSNPDLCKQMSSSTQSAGSALGHQGYPEAAELVPSDLDMLLNQHVTNVKCEEPSFEQYSSFGNDLFDIFGDDLKSKILCGGNFPSSVTDGPVVGDFSQSFLGGGDVFAEAEGDHLLDAVVTKAARSASKQCSGEDNVSCKTTATKISTSSALTPTPRVSPAYQIEMETMIYPKLSEKLTVSCSPSNSFYGSQISSWVEQSHSVKDENSISTAYSKKPDGSKPNRKRLKPGENPRPRPKDRQMIQDRVKELRDIVPNGAKCSIDALLERTIKHLLFLQSVTKHADKLKESGESKIMNKDGGVVLKDNFEGGATWAFEVGSQSMVCPIIVEDLNPPRQMLVEMLCEDRGFFLEIADIIRGLGLTILKGVMEARNDKVWARFAVEANRDVTRMEIFMSLVSVLEQTVKGGSRAVENNPMIHR